ALEALRLATGKAQFVAPSIRPESLSRAAIKCAQRAGLNGSIHTLRHTYISHLVMAGVPLRTVQVLAGHSTIAVTERYAHLTPSHLRSAGTSISL
ncbi:MAG: tyrosine-type recombinase/integrase, partial [Burkholderiales bacterium]